MKKTITFVLALAFLVSLMGIGHAQEKQPASINISAVTGFVYKIYFQPLAGDYSTESADVAFEEGGKMKVQCGPISTTGFYVPMGSAFFGLFYSNSIIYSFTAFTTEKIPGTSLMLLAGGGYLIDLAGAGAPLVIYGYNKDLTE